MNAIMNDTSLNTLAQVRSFLAGTLAVEFSFATTADRYAWIEQTLVRFDYRRLGKVDKGLRRRYLQKLTGYSRAQLARLIIRQRVSGRVRRQGSARHRFTRRYTAEDVRLLAHTDTLHNTLSGPATKKILEREYQVFGHDQYARLAGISVSHLYNLRQQPTYRGQRQTLTKTRSTSIPIGERRKPQPEGRPGYLRVDSVHQGDWDGHKGLYHINAVDEITQWQVIVTVEKISEAYLIPALAALLDNFPFRLLGFHADNGSEYINYQVAQLLNKLLIEFTKSRSRQTNDNALAESKNGSTVRKHFGYSHIPQKYAALVNAFNRAHLNPYLVFHRPCFFPENTVDAKGRQRKRYRYKDMMTPYDKLKSLPEAESFRKTGVTFTALDALAFAISDNEAASRLSQARQLLFQQIHGQDVA